MTLLFAEKAVLPVKSEGEGARVVSCNLGGAQIRCRYDQMALATVTCGKIVRMRAVTCVIVCAA